ncbi:glycosyltransferase family 4 protein [Paenibacillus spiritus]|uniref:Glycosyltransferase family 4 protein n=1 Tax=Paenibacillus spiritus TaxID=2496557 RepID=A0A5J5FUA2_9BACL|nr:glycosyltransferase [Paenibacillus spiritus]KAA8996586.1 glycosyltransferase family 4 protein [Paenibacillus spiritus]
MKKTGVFLGFHPGTNLSNEGIGRLLAFLLKENNSDTKDMILFCPEWLRHSILLLMKDNNIPDYKFDIVSTNAIPLGIRLKEYITGKKKPKKARLKKSDFFNKTKLKISMLLKKGVEDFFGTSSLFFVVVKVICYLLLVVCCLPFLILFSLLYLVYKLILLIYKLLYKVTPYKSTILKFSNIAKNSKGWIYQRVIDAELEKIVKCINKNKIVDVCYIPSMIWPQIKKLKCKKILAAPDIVFYDFPTQFPGVGYTHRRIRESIQAADHLICYSEYVKLHHYVERCGVSPEKITVIKHANINMAEHLKLSKHVLKYMTVEQNAREIINEYIQKKYKPDHVLYNSHLSDFDLITYSSQYRAHKNIFNLIKAVKIINKQLNGNVKLILTGNYLIEEAIKDYVKDNFLENDIFIFYGISSRILAALNSQAKLAVNPTLFEGGFPFTFSESFSVGTPSIMSNIPVVSNEILDLSLKEKMLFNPFDPYAIAEKIVMAIENRNELYQAQQALYNQFSTRDWRKVAYEYNQVFNQFI